MENMNTDLETTNTDEMTTSAVEAFTNEIVMELMLRQPDRPNCLKGALGDASDLYKEEALENNVYTEGTDEDWKPVIEYLTEVITNTQPSDQTRDTVVGNLQSKLFVMASQWMTRSAGLAGAGKGWGANRALSQLFTGAVAVSWGNPTCAPHAVNTIGEQLGGIDDLDQMLNQGVVKNLIAGADLMTEARVKALSTSDFLNRLSSIPEYSNGVLLRDVTAHRVVFGDRTDLQYRTMTRIEHTLLLVRWSYSVARALYSTHVEREPWHMDSQAHTAILNGNGYHVIATVFDGTLNRKVKEQSKVVLDKMRQLKKQSAVTSALHSPFPFAFVGGYVTAGAGYNCPRAVNSVIIAMPAISFTHQDGEEE